MNPQDCDKHHLKIIGAKDNFLHGEVYFQCSKCGIGMIADRFWLYLSMTRGVVRSRGH